MHVHASQINPCTQTDALYAAERAAAKRAAERTRKKLLELASGVGGEAESEVGCVVRLGEREDADDRANAQNQQDRANRKGRKNRPDPEGADSTISDWA